MPNGPIEDLPDRLIEGGDNTANNLVERGQRTIDGLMGPTQDWVKRLIGNDAK